MAWQVLETPRSIGRAWGGLDGLAGIPFQKGASHQWLTFLRRLGLGGRLLPKMKSGPSVC